MPDERPGVSNNKGEECDNLVQEEDCEYEEQDLRVAREDLQ